MSIYWSYKKYYVTHNLIFYGSIDGQFTYKVLKYFIYVNCGWSMYRNICEYGIKYTDVDAYDNLKPSALLSFLEESACRSADELGFGYDVISPRGLGFIIVNNYIELYRPIKLGEKLSVHTWPLKPRHMIFLRDYELFSGSEKVGVSTTRWCMIDTRSFTMTPASSFFPEGFFDGYNTERSVDFKNWKLPSASGDAVYTKLITYSDYDHYFHVNNAKYADFLLDVFSAEDFKDKYISKLQVTYSKQCKMGERLDMYKSPDGDGLLVEGRVGDEPRVLFRVEFNGI